MAPITQINWIISKIDSELMINFRRIHKIAFLFVFTLIFNSLATAQVKLLLYSGKFTSTQPYQKFEVTEIIDARWDKSHIGLFYDSNTQKTDSVFTEKSLDSTLNYYFKLCQNKRENQQSVILKVNYLEFSNRKTKNKEYVWAFCDFSIYVQKPTGIYEVGRETCALEGKVQGSGRLSDLSKVNWFLWNKVFDKINGISFRTSKSEPVSSSLMQARITTPEIAFTNFFTPGLYLQYKELLKNKPSIPVFKVTSRKLYKSENSIKRWEFEMADSTQNGNFKKMKAAAIWGYCKNGKLFVRVENQQFVEIEPLGTTFEIAGIAMKIQRTQQKQEVIATSAFNAAYSIFLGAAINPIILGIAILALLDQSQNQRLMIVRNNLVPISIYNLSDI